MMLYNEERDSRRDCEHDANIGRDKSSRRGGNDAINFTQG